MDVESQKIWNPGAYAESSEWNLGFDHLSVQNILGSFRAWEYLRYIWLPNDVIVGGITRPQYMSNRGEEEEPPFLKIITC